MELELLGKLDAKLCLITDINKTFFLIAMNHNMINI